MTAWTYILRCSDNSYYVGSTRVALQHRVDEHQSGSYRGYTFARRPVELVWSQEFAAITDAIASERQIKGWRRAKKDALVRGDFDLLSTLSKRYKKLRTGRQRLETQDSPFETGLRPSSG